jgi:hypothetical protein
MMRRRRLISFFLLLTLSVPAASAFAGELGGSLRALRRANKVAKRSEFRFLRNVAEVREWVRTERLVTFTSTTDYVINDVSFPYARPAVKLFLDRLAAQYRAATGERLVVTSLTRPLSQQPENASALSVHPAGMAVDLRVPARAKNRLWLEQTLLTLEDKSVLDVTRERHPKHYHVAVFPAEYERYVAHLTN